MADQPQTIYDRALRVASIAACEGVAVSLASTPTVLRAARMASDAAVSETLAAVEQEARRRAVECGDLYDVNRAAGQSLTKLADWLKNVPM